jgi:hypothetical protein
MEPHTTVIIPFDNRILLIRPLHCAHFSSRLCEVAQTLNAVPGD